MASDLKELDNRPVRIDIPLNEQWKTFRGHGRLMHDPSLGDVLGIKISDPTGDFEVLIQADHWSGEVRSDASGLSDFHICLNAAMQ